MPSNRFGCGEIATGFKPAGFPPGFFVSSRVIPTNTGGGGSGTGGGIIGGPDPTWRCEDIKKLPCADIPRHKTLTPEIVIRDCVKDLTGNAPHATKEICMIQTPCLSDVCQYEEITETRDRERPPPTGRPGVTTPGGSPTTPTGPTTGGPGPRPDAWYCKQTQPPNCSFFIPLNEECECTPCKCTVVQSPEGKNKWSCSVPGGVNICGGASTYICKPKNKCKAGCAGKKCPPVERWKCIEKSRSLCAGSTPGIGSHEPGLLGGLFVKIDRECQKCSAEEIAAGGQGCIFTNDLCVSLGVEMCKDQDCPEDPPFGGGQWTGPSAARAPSRRYRCIEANRRSCGVGYVGNYITRFCEECLCYKIPGVIGERCFDLNSNPVEKSEFPFTSPQECESSCTNERCSPIGIPTKTYECDCANNQPCTGFNSATGSNVQSQVCNCTQCYCDDEDGVRVCRNSKGKIIGTGEKVCTKSLNDCQTSCSDRGCPSWSKWGCLETKGNKCLSSPPEEELITECVEATCKDGVNGVECIPLNVPKEQRSNIRRGEFSFNSRGECETDRLSPYGSCKSQLCANSTTNIRGVSYTIASAFQAIPPPNLGIRKYKAIDVKHLMTSEESGRSIYNTDFNFSNRGFSREISELTRGHSYPRIFNEYISPIVQYFLVHKGEGSWDEVYVNELRNNINHLIKSLNPNLNLIFNNLTYPTGKKVNPNHIYNGLIELLLTGKLDEFDPDYFDGLYGAQNNMEILEYKPSSDKDENDKVALGILADSIVPADPKKIFR